jgi:phosphate starvation-inducible PhoH-like protein
MKMFLTRIGFGSTAVVTGDITQIDLPRGEASGLINVRDVLARIAGIEFTHFGSKDVVRHPLVQKIVDAYESFNGQDNDRQNIDGQKMGRRDDERRGRGRG